MLAYHFHWSRQEIMDLEHAERVRFIEQLVKVRGGGTPPAPTYNF